MVECSAWSLRHPGAVWRTSVCVRHHRGDAHGRGGDAHGRGGDAHGRGRDACGRDDDARGRDDDARGRDDDARGCAHGAHVHRLHRTPHGRAYLVLWKHEAARSHSPKTAKEQPRDNDHRGFFPPRGMFCCPVMNFSSVDGGKMRLTAHPEITARAKTPTANALRQGGVERPITPNVLIFVAGPVIKTRPKHLRTYLYAQKDCTKRGCAGGTYVDRNANECSKRHFKRIMNAVESRGLHKWLSDGPYADPHEHPWENFIDILGKPKTHCLS